jgi:hypothetical protein
MKINIKRTPEQIELVKLMGSKDRTKAIAAMESFAGFIAPVVSTVIASQPTLSNLFKDLPYDEYSSPSIPLDLYYDVKDKGYINVWSQSIPGGLATQQTTGISELMIATYPLFSAVSFLKDYARQGRLDVVAKTLERMAQEVLFKQEQNAASVVMSALANATFTKNGVSTSHIYRTNTANAIVLDDFNKLLTLAARINSSYTSGTPAQTRGITDLIGSPEFIEKLRAMAYNPMVNGSKTDIPATDKMRDAVYESSGIPSFYGINIVQVFEMGVGYPWNALFDAYAGSTTYPGYAGGAAAAFDGTADELVLGIDMSREVLVRPILTDSETSGTFTVLPDDQWVTRSEKVGFYGKLREGRVVLDDRALVGLVW